MDPEVDGSVRELRHPFSAQVDFDIDASGRFDSEVDGSVREVLHPFSAQVDFDIDVSGRFDSEGAHLLAFIERAQSLMMLTVLSKEPLLETLLAEAAECGCSPLGSLSVQSVSLCGSSAEEFLTIYEGVSGDFIQDSDMDFMVELGPVSWAADAPHEAAGLRLVPLLKLEASENAGFVRVLQVPGSSCDHRQPLPLSAGRVRQVMHDLLRVIHPEAHSITVAGPAITFDLELDEIDWVACLHVPWQQSRERFAETTPLDWLPPAAREDVWRDGMHLVPTGCKGSVTEDTEWRLSFSRAELVVAWYLPNEQKFAIVLVKDAKRQLFERGRAVKSYFIKTALYWVCQQTPRHQWGSATQCARRIIDFLLAAVAARRLPSFFCNDINLFRQVSPTDLEKMQQILGVLGTDFNRLVLYDLRRKGPRFDFLMSKTNSSTSPSDSIAPCCIKAHSQGHPGYLIEKRTQRLPLGIFPTILPPSSGRQMKSLHYPWLRALTYLSSERLDDRWLKGLYNRWLERLFNLRVVCLSDRSSERLDDLLSERLDVRSSELDILRGLAQLETNLSLQALYESVPGLCDRSDINAVPDVSTQLSFQHYKDREMKRTLTEMTADLQARLHLSQPNADRIAQQWLTSHRRYWSDPDTETRFNTYPRDPWQLLSHLHR